MSQRGKSTIDVGSYVSGARFTWTPTSEHVDAEGVLEVDVWDAEEEPSHVALDAGAALALAQWINEQLGRD